MISSSVKDSEDFSLYKSETFQAYFLTYPFVVKDDAYVKLSL